MKSFSRKLGLVEKFMTLGHEVGGGLIVNIVYIKGFLTPDTIKKALTLVQKRHPILQVYIVEHEDGFYFESEGIYVMMCFPASITLFLYSSLSSSIFS